MQEEISFLVSQYTNLEVGIKNITEVTRGYLSKNFIIETASGKYFLKQYRTKDQKRIEDIQAVKQFFYSHGIPVVLPILNKRDERLIKINDDFYSLFPFVSGFHFSEGKVPLQTVESLGEMLGRIHKAGENGYPEIGTSLKSWNKQEFFKNADNLLKTIRTKSEKTNFDHKALQAIQLKKELVEKEGISYENLGNLQRGLIHGDYHNENVFFSENGNVTYVFDFERTTIAPFVYEIVRAIRYSYVTGYGKKGSEKLVKEFIRSYRLNREVSKEELEAGEVIFYQNAIYGLWVEKEHYLKNNPRADSLLSTAEDLINLKCSSLIHGS